MGQQPASVETVDPCASADAHQQSSHHQACGRRLPEPTFMRTPLFAQLRSRGGLGGGGAAGAGEGVSVSNALKFADNLSAVTSSVYDTLVHRLSRTMMVLVEDIDMGKSIHAYKVDRLVTPEFRCDYLFPHLIIARLFRTSRVSE